jgi:hypothetical protein
MAALDAERLRAIFARLGDALARPTTLCLIGSAPAIATGQPDRQTADIDLWHSASDYDAADLERACKTAGLLYDPRDELVAGAIYVQVVRPGVVRLPDNFEVDLVGTFGKLTVVMPKPSVLVAAKLTRGNEIDIHDAVWWVTQSGMETKELETAIGQLPRARDRETALENLVFVRLAKGG